MSIKLEKVVPWGRSLAEYIRMFNLTADELQRSLLDCAAGPASFNAEMTQQGYQVISCDPIYQFTANEIAQQIQETYPLVISSTEANQENFVWQEMHSPEHLGQVRMKAMHQFLEDFPAGLQAGRYLTAELPVLPFGSRQFDLALCSHFLFTYSDQLSFDFHLEAIAEMSRVAAEVRIFPLLVMAGEVSPFLQPALSELNQQGYQSEITTVPYEFQRGGNRMLRVWLESDR